MKAMVVPAATAAFAREDRPVPEPGPGEIRIKVRARGICHSDKLVKEGLRSGLTLPRVQGWASGTAVDSTDAMEFAAQHGVEAMIETFLLAKAGDACARMISGKARFRVVPEVA